MKRTIPLSRSTPLPGSGALRRVSPKRRKAEAEKQKAYKVFDATQDHWCAACGCSFQLERSHCLTQKQWQHHRANPENLLYLCTSDHDLWEHNKAGFARKYPEVFAQKVGIIRRLEPQQYAVLAMKHPHLFP